MKNKNKKKGFTLVEVLSVLILIGLLFGLGIPGIVKIRDKMRLKSFNTKVNLIEQAAVLYGQDNKTLLSSNECKWDYNVTNNKLNNNYPCKEVTLSELIEEDYLDGGKNTDKYIDPITGSDLTNTCVYIYKKNNRVESYYSMAECDDIVITPGKTITDTVVLTKPTFENNCPDDNWENDACSQGYNLTIEYNKVNESKLVYSIKDKDGNIKQEQIDKDKNLTLNEDNDENVIVAQNCISNEVCSKESEYEVKIAAVPSNINIEYLNKDNEYDNIFDIKISANAADNIYYGFVDESTLEEYENTLTIENFNLNNPDLSFDGDSLKKNIYIKACNKYNICLEEPKIIDIKVRNIDILSNVKDDNDKETFDSLIDDLKTDVGLKEHNIIIKKNYINKFKKSETTNVWYNRNSVTIHGTDIDGILGNNIIYHFKNKLYGTTIVRIFNVLTGSDVTYFTDSSGNKITPVLRQQYDSLISCRTASCDYYGSTYTPDYFTTTNNKNLIYWKVGNRTYEGTCQMGRKNTLENQRGYGYYDKIYYVCNLDGNNNNVKCTNEATYRVYSGAQDGACASYQYNYEDITYSGNSKYIKGKKSSVSPASVTYGSGYFQIKFFNYNYSKTISDNDKNALSLDSLVSNGVITTKEKGDYANVSYNSNPVYFQNGNSVGRLYFQYKKYNNSYVVFWLNKNINTTYNFDNIIPDTNNSFDCDDNYNFCFSYKENIADKTVIDEENTEILKKTILNRYS